MGDVFVPESVWLGSANWTNASSSGHLEFGTFSTDRALVRGAYDFLADLLSVSEPFDSKARRPTPDMAPAEYDDEAFGNAARAMWGTCQRSLTNQPRRLPAADRGSRGGEDFGRRSGGMPAANRLKGQKRRPVDLSGRPVTCQGPQGQACVCWASYRSGRISGG
ncbi:hypothetical protein GCM10020001_050010 [Nonomuraea salmonea]